MRAGMLALAADAPTLLVIGVVGVAVLGVAWFALRFWLASTRPANIQEIRTPSLDRINRQALEKMGDMRAGEDQEGSQGDEPPAELKKAVPTDEPA